ncbi:GntR family transcriptional regulator [Altererythrobacter salegens]|uniref:GntR family transcriptional regulator n=1 Tax=Croceibacterium salegens TaxID=1737568 RepID=A0A6I4SX90_9SPHN|nr:GntR family transcriptional regulator [Croceibacterium salegens]MXO60655.1 GntR family transcriptional regulator [Croceibacterium salegens]
MPDNNKRPIMSVAHDTDVLATIGRDEEREKQHSPFERVHRGILRGLYEGRFVPGQRLVAPDLMRQFDVGRGTIREVLQRLASTGVIRILPQKGAQVRRMTRREVVEILDLVEVMLGLGARGSAGAMADPERRAQLQREYEILMACKFDEDFAGFLAAREAYYRSVIAMGGNRELQRIFPAIQVHIMRVQLRAFDHAADAANPADYRLLHEAIVSGDAHAAEHAGRQHVQRTIGRIAQLPDRAFEPGE